MVAPTKVSDMNALDKLVLSVPTPVLVGAELMAIIKALQDTDWMNKYTAVAVLGGYLLYHKEQLG